MVNAAVLLTLTSLLPAQETTITLRDVQELSRLHYPLIKEKDLLNRTQTLQLENLDKAWLPQLILSGQATYQSDVTRVNIPIPNIKIDAPAKDQYKIFGEVNQLIFDGGQNKVQHHITTLNNSVGREDLEVQLYAVKNRVNGLYTGILYIDELIRQVRLTKLDIQTGIAKTAALVNNGVAFKSNLQLLQAELLKAGQREEELLGTRAGLLNTLSLFINRRLDSSARLVIPLVQAEQVFADPIINRPELKAMEQRSRLAGAQKDLIRARNMPKAGLFIQGGYGRPALNLLDNNFDLYYIGGIRLSWNLGGLYSVKNDRELIALSQRNIEIQKEAFLFNSNAELSVARADIARLKKVVAMDAEIIMLRNQVKSAARAQLENGVITANDYLREVNAADQAEQARITHNIQLLQAIIHYNDISGNTILPQP